jgi:AraC-like DNA-binding protein
MLPDVALSLRSYSPITLAHRHSHHQAVLPIRGRLQMEIGSAQGQVEIGCAGLVAPGEWHGCRADSANEFLVLDWDPAGTDDGLRRFSDRVAEDPFAAYAPSLQLLIQFLGNGIRPHDRIAAHQGDWALMLLRALATGDDRPSWPQAVDRAIDFARRRFQHPIAVADLANAARVSPSQIHALFRHNLGRTPMAFVSDLRLEHAAALLAGSESPIADIALACGYGDQTALTRAMQRRHRTTPAAYRRRARRR